MTPKRGTGRPENGYYNAVGVRLPSVTTITGRGKDGGGLVYAAKKNWHEAGRRGLPFARDAYWGKPENWGTEATEAGMIAHQWIEDTIHGDALTPYLDADDRVVEQAEVGFAAFLKWQRRVRLEIVETEVPLVSEAYGFAGTLDALANVDGEPALFDWKTSNATYVDYIAQVAAYRQLLVERDGDTAPREAYLVRVGKEFGDFHEHYWPAQVLDFGWRWFLAALELHRTDGLLKKVAA